VTRLFVRPEGAKGMRVASAVKHRLDAAAGQIEGGPIIPIGQIALHLIQTRLAAGEHPGGQAIGPQGHDQPPANEAAPAGNEEPMPAQKPSRRR
jgi:hypothetical protein